MKGTVFSDLGFGYRLDGLTADAALALDDKFLRRLVYDHKLLVISGQPSSTEHVAALARKFGVLWTDESYRVVQDQGLEQGTTLFSNTTDHKSLNADLPWHRDISWYRGMRYPLRVLAPVECDEQTVPTYFADANVALGFLFSREVQALREVEVCVQHLWSWDRQQKKSATGTRWIPLMEQHPVTGKWNLMLDSFGPYDPNQKYSTRASASWIVGVGNREAGTKAPQSFLNRLHLLAMDAPRNFYAHQWKPGDFLIFDNFSGLMHRRPAIRQQGAVRTFRRVNIYHEGQTHDPV